MRVVSFNPPSVLIELDPGECAMLADLCRITANDAGTAERLVREATATALECAALCSYRMEQARADDHREYTLANMRDGWALPRHPDEWRDANGQDAVLDHQPADACPGR